MLLGSVILTPPPSPNLGLFIGKYEKGSRNHFYKKLGVQQFFVEIFFSVPLALKIFRGSNSTKRLAEGVWMRTFSMLVKTPFSIIFSKLPLVILFFFWISSFVQIHLISTAEHRSQHSKTSDKKYLNMTRFGEKPKSETRFRIFLIFWMDDIAPIVFRPLGVS